MIRQRRWYTVVVALFFGLALALGIGLDLPAARPGRALQNKAGMGGLIVLAYHEIDEPAKAVMPDYVVTPENFRAQLAWLKDHDFHFVSLDQVLRARAGKELLPEHPVLLSFDDGYRSVFTNAFPLLEQYKAPAIIALVGTWLAPKDGENIQFGDQLLARERMLSWDQLRIMLKSGLVEIASHTYDLHHGINANPQANSEPAVTTRLYEPAKGYENESAFRQRLKADLLQNNELMEQQLKRHPRVVVWPYGRYNKTAIEVADQLGMPVGLTLNDGEIFNETALNAMPRILMTQELGGATGLAAEISLRNRDASDNNRAAKVMHVDLDNIYDPNPVQIERNLKLLLSRIRAMGVNTVYLQAYADPDGNGAADSVYFPNRHLPVRADLFNHVAWEIRTRTPVRRLYAWMPVLAFELPKYHPAAKQVVKTQKASNGHLNMGYPRLSPFAPQAMAVVKDLYEDLSRYATFDGLLFHDDVTLSDYEDASPWGLSQYKRWGLPADLAKIRADDKLQGQWVINKIKALDALTLELASVVRKNQSQLRTARNLYAQVVLNPKAEVWYSQSIDDSLRNYDFTAVMAMPYMEQAKDHQHFLAAIVEQVKKKPMGLKKVLFELQSTDWRSHQDLPSQELANQISSLYNLGVRHVGYYPDNLHRGTPDPAVLQPVLAAHSSAPTD